MKEEIKNLCDIRIDKEGTWYYRGAEMYRTDIVQYLYQYLKKDEKQDYYIEMSDYDRCRIDVEDTAFVVTSVEKLNWDEGAGKGEIIRIRLSDGSEEVLCLDSLSISTENVLYCDVKGNTFKARFSRKSYYQIIKDVEYDEKLETYYLKMNGHRYFIKENE